MSVKLQEFKLWFNKNRTNIAKGIIMMVLSSGLLYYVFFYLLKLSKLSHTYSIILQYTSWAVLVIGFMLGYFFNTSRVFFILLIMLVVQITVERFSIGRIDQLEVISGVLHLILPLNLIAFSLFKERGIVSFWGLAKVFFLVVQLIGFYTFFLIWLEREYLIKCFENNILLSIYRGDICSVMLMVVFLTTLILLVHRAKNATDFSFIGLLITLLISTLFLGEFEKQGLYVFTFIGGTLLVTGIIIDIYLMAYRDGLTGLPSRRALRAALMRLGSRYTIAMIDIDHFKNFNDQYGHDVGDQVLTLLSKYLRGVKGRGKVYRYGGEEFTILFPGKNKEEVVNHLEDLRKKVANRVFIIRSKSRTKSKSPNIDNPVSIPESRKEHITISIGVAQKDSKYKNPDEVIKAADRALYVSKSKGRNRITTL